MLFVDFFAVQSLHDYNMNLANFTFYQLRQDNHFLFLFLN